MAARPRSVAILGLGLIGGSVAHALRRAGGWHVVAWDRSPAVAARALGDGVVEALAPDPANAASSVELVLLATPVPAGIELIGRLGPSLAAADIVLSDVGSTKAAVADAAAGVPGLRFVGGHPMSGREASGYDAADEALFDGRPWVVVPGPTARRVDIARVTALAMACGARPVRMTAGAHDRAVAAISHLPLLASVALAEAMTGTADWSEAAPLAAQGWRDMTRLARGGPAMGAGILATNAPAVAERLRAYRAVLEAWQARLDTAAGDRLATEVEAALAAVAQRLAEAPPERA